MPQDQIPPTVTQSPSSHRTDSQALHSPAATPSKGTKQGHTSTTSATPSPTKRARIDQDLRKAERYVIPDGQVFTLDCGKMFVGLQRADESRALTFSSKGHVVTLSSKDVKFLFKNQSKIEKELEPIPEAAEPSTTSRPPRGGRRSRGS